VCRWFAARCGEARVRSEDQLNMDLSNSPGWPWKQRFRTKAAAIEQAPEEVRKLWQYPSRDARIVWHGFRKKEILPIAKAAEKARLVTGAPVDLAVLGARLYEDMNERMTSQHTMTHSAVGMSKFHGGWDRLARKFPGGVTEADAKQWDSGMTERLLRAVYTVRWFALRDEDQTPDNWERHNCYVDNLIQAPIHLSDGSMWAVWGGNKSGSVNTAHDNTLGHILVCMYAWLRTGLQEEAFWEHPFALYGDDFLSGALPEVFFEHYREVGIKLPVENVKQHKSIQDATFLSQYFLLKDGMYMAVPKSLKYVLAAATSDIKPSLELAHSRVTSLWLDAFWSPHEPLFRSVATMLAEKLGQPGPSRLWARGEWLGLERVSSGLCKRVTRQSEDSVGSNNLTATVLNGKATQGTEQWTSEADAEAAACEGARREACG